MAKIDQHFTAGFSRFTGTSLLSVANIIKKYYWSPVLYSRNYRKKINFEASYYLVLDFETPDVTLEDAKKSFCDCKHIIGLTRNHQKPKGHIPPLDRFRVVIPWEKPINNIDVFEYNNELAMKHWDADVSCKDAAHGYFRCTEIVSIGLEGFSQDVKDIPPGYSQEAKLTKARQRAAAGVMATFCKQALTNVIPTGERNQTIFKLGCEFARLGFTYDHSLHLVLTSPTYQRQIVTGDLLHEIREALTNGFKAESRHG